MEKNQDGNDGDDGDGGDDDYLDSFHSPENLGKSFKPSSGSNSTRVFSNNLDALLSFTSSFHHSHCY